MINQVLRSCVAVAFSATSIATCAAILAAPFSAACASTPAQAGADAGGSAIRFGLSMGKIQTAALSGEAYLLKALDYGTNIGLLKTSKGIVLIDPMPGSGNLDALHETVRALAGDSAVFVLNTHAHEDHSGGNAFISERGAQYRADASGFPEIHQVSASSHTPDDKVYFHKASNSIFVGDIYDSYWHPTFYAGGLSGFEAAIEAILKLGDERSWVVPGHGSPTDKLKLLAFRNNTVAWVSRVKALKTNGLSALEIRNDAQLLAILERFNLEGRAEFIPEKALVRFIERTLAVIDRGV